AVVDVSRRGEIVLELPGEPDRIVVMRVSRPPRRVAPRDRFPQARDAVGEAIKGRAEPDVVDERERRFHAANAQGRQAAQVESALREQPRTGWNIKRRTRSW